MAVKLVVSDEQYERWVTGWDWGWTTAADRELAEVLDYLKKRVETSDESDPLLAHFTCLVHGCAGASVPYRALPVFFMKGDFGVIHVCKRCGWDEGYFHVRPIPASFAWSIDIGACPTCLPGTEQVPNPDTKEVICTGCDYTTDDGVRWWKE